MTKLITRVKSHCNGQATSGQVTLALVKECIEHMRDHDNEWTPLATLISMSQPAQARMVRKIVGQVLIGWRVAKDDKQPTGLRFSKISGSNQGFDPDLLSQLGVFITDKCSIQSNDVKDYFTPESESVEKTHEQLLEATVKSLRKRLERDNITWEQVVSVMVAEPNF